MQNRKKCNENNSHAQKPFEKCYNIVNEVLYFFRTVCKRFLNENSSQLPLHQSFKLYEL